MFAPKKVLTERDVSKGLRLVIADGLTAEVIIAFTGGAFLVALALMLGATNFQIGLLAALPTFTNFFQLISVWMVRRCKNRKGVTVVASIIARLPLIGIGLLPFMGNSVAGVDLLIFFLFFHYLFSSIAGPSWNSWMKDLVPETELGAYFSRRSSYTQALNVALSLLAALAVDFVKSRNPELIGNAYGTMFIAAGVSGLIGAFILSSVPEPPFSMADENTFKLLARPLRDKNFQRLMWFNCAWAFALNIAAPFFTVFMLRSLSLSLSYIIGLTVISQLASIFTIRVWGKFADRYSNKTIIAISAPLYILALIAWCFVGLSSYVYVNVVMLVLIHLLTGVANAGINLSITNLGLKLAPKDDAIVYLSVRNMLLSVFASVAPLIGGKLADYFLKRSLTISLEWTSPTHDKLFYLASLHDWNFLFLIGALLSLIALELLVHVNEVGEVEKELVVKIMRSSIRSNLKDFFIIGTLISWHEQLWEVIKRRLSWH